MRWPEDKTNPFPSWHRHEPSGLRADILDELADHLALSAEHEMEHNGQTQPAAWARALDRFGDPDAVARRLWWDAMKGKIMRDWIQTCVSLVSAIVVVLVAVYVVMNMQAMQATQAQLAETLKQMDGRAKTAQGETLDVEVLRGKPDGPPAAGVHVKLTGKVNGDTDATVSLDTDAKGHAKFFPVPQGGYTLNLDDPRSGMTLHASHSLFAGIGSTRRFIAPDFAAVKTQVVANPPFLFPNDRMVTGVEYDGELDLGDCHWRVDGQFLAGKAGFYELVKTNDQRHMKVKAPVPFVMLPPLELKMEAEPRFVHPKDPPDTLSTAVVSNDFVSHEKQMVTLAASQENTVTLNLTETQVNAAVKYLMGHTQKKWLPEMDPNSPPLNAYVVAASPVAQVSRVSCERKGDTAATATVVNSKPPSGTPVMDYSTDWLLLRLADLKQMAEAYPPECRFLVISAKVESGEALPWTAQECPLIPGKTFPVGLGKVLPWGEAVQPTPLSGGSAPRRPLPGYILGGWSQTDITTFIRSEAAAVPCAGLLLHASASELDVITPGLLPDGYASRAPALLVVRDTPPEDL
jgi:hypothetical protein